MICWKREDVRHYTSMQERTPLLASSRRWLPCSRDPTVSDRSAEIASVPDYGLLHAHSEAFAPLCHASRCAPLRFNSGHAHVAVLKMRPSSSVRRADNPGVHRDDATEPTHTHTHTHTISTHRDGKRRRGAFLPNSRATI
jgi:hypothetical protein